jgi:hypothetical protein
VYQITYKDPMTGTILETQAHSLADAVAAIQKAKDDLYYRGHSLQKNESATESTTGQEDSDLEQQSQAEIEESSDEEDLSEDDRDLDEFIHPYGVTLW